MNSAGIRIHIAGPKVGLYDSGASGFQRHALLDAVLGPLLCPDETMDGGLLESWTSSNDSCLWELRLRSGLRFHNGREVDSADLAHSLSQIIACPHQTPDKTLLSGVASNGIRIKGERTVEIRLVRADPLFPLLIKDSFFSILPKEELLPTGHGLKGPSPNSGSHIAWKSHPIGAGPYKVTETSDGGSVVVVEAARDLPAGAPRNIRFSTGDCPPDADLVMGCESNPLPGRLRKTVVDTPLAIMGLYFDYSHPLARNPDFRAAVATAVDRASISRLIEDAKPAHGMIPSNFRTGLSKTVGLAAQDQSRAAALFKKVFGNTPPKTIDIPARNRFIDGKPLPWLAELEKQLNEAGCPARMTPGSGHSPLAVAGFIPGIVDLGQLYSLFRAGGGWVSRLEERDEVYEDLLSGISRARDRAEREQLIISLHERFEERAYAVPIYEEPVAFWTNSARVAVGTDQGIHMNYERLRVLE